MIRGSIAVESGDLATVRYIDAQGRSARRGGLQGNIAVLGPWGGRMVVGEEG